MHQGCESSDFNLKVSIFFCSSQNPINMFNVDDILQENGSFPHKTKHEEDNLVVCLM